MVNNIVDHLMITFSCSLLIFFKKRSFCNVVHFASLLLPFSGHSALVTAQASIARITLTQDLSSD